MRCDAGAALRVGEREQQIALQPLAVGVPRLEHGKRPLEVRGRLFEGEAGARSPACRVALAASMRAGSILVKGYDRTDVRRDAVGDRR